MTNKLQVPALGARSGVRKNITHRNKLKTEIKDGQNGTKIGASNIFGVMSLYSVFQLSSSSNDSDKDKSFRSNFCHQEGSGATFKYSLMLG